MTMITTVVAIAAEAAIVTEPQTLSRYVPLQVLQLLLISLRTHTCSLPVGFVEYQAFKGHPDKSALPAVTLFKQF